MEIYASSKLEKLLQDERALKRKYGQKVSEKISQRYAELLVAVNLAEISTLPPPRLHQLKGARKDEFALDLTANYRLVFEAYDVNDELTTNREKAVAILIKEVVDYH